MAKMGNVSRNKQHKFVRKMVKNSPWGYETVDKRQMVSRLGE
jgi:hypothetical protein